MYVPRSYHVEERAARYRGIERGSVGSFDACSAGADRTGLTEKERAGHDFAHDLSARDGFSGFAPGFWQQVQADMLCSLLATMAHSFNVWSARKASAEKSAPNAPYVAPSVKPGALKAARAARGERKAMIDAAQRETVDGVSLTRLPTGGKRERRVTK